ncbi:hypothetical protein [Nocardia sp. NBC_01327]|uniref:hypothetical protein n=1 Tax=Nocardia sp. NBC_01327 TaxID=2903593 RepID=UPI002E0D18ED|nr:hypothetical protein OG326_10675 [Nocardia sp. NBC_01327]
MGISKRNGQAAPVAAALGMAAALTVLAAPAGATATRVGVEPALSFGSATNYGTGCTYPVDAYVDDPSTPVGFYDNGIRFGVATPSGSIAIANWTPATTGAHRLQIIQQTPTRGGDVVPYIDLTVGTGLSTGSGCNVFGGG